MKNNNIYWADLWWFSTTPINLNRNGIARTGFGDERE